MSTIRDKLKIKQLEKDKQIVKEQFCEEQQTDIEWVVDACEDLVSTAVSCGSSPQNYSELQRAKAEFIENLLARSEKYRVVDVT